MLPIARAILDGDLALRDEAPPLWDGHSGERIADVVVTWLARAGNDIPAEAGWPVS